MCILPVPSYGIEETTFTKRNFSRMRKVTTATVRKMLNILFAKDKISLEYIKSQTGVSDVVEHISEQKQS